MYVPRYSRSEIGLQHRLEVLCRDVLVDGDQVLSLCQVLEEVWNGFGLPAPIWTVPNIHKLVVVDEACVGPQELLRSHDAP